MPYSFVSAVDAGIAANGGDGITGAKVTASVTYADHDRIVVFTNRATGGQTETLTDGTNTYTKVGSDNMSVSGDTLCQYEVRDAIAVTGATLTQNLQSGSPSAFRGMHVMRYSGLDNSSPCVQVFGTSAAFGTATDAVTCGDVNPNVVPGALIGHYYDTSSGTNSTVAGTGFTSRSTFPTEAAANTSNSRAEDKRITALGAVKATFTTTLGTDLYAVFGVFIPEPFTPAGLYYPLETSLYG